MQETESMSRKHIIQVPLSEKEHELATGLAGRSGRSVASWARARLFGENSLLAHAKFCPVFSDAEREARLLTSPTATGIVTYLDVLDFPTLHLLRLHSGAAAEVFEVLDAERLPVPHFKWDERSRFVVGGSPWPYRILDDYSMYGLQLEARTIFLMKNCRNEKAFFEVPKLRLVGPS
jgi:hypothetical protein